MLVGKNYPMRHGYRHANSLKLIWMIIVSPVSIWNSIGAFSPQLYSMQSNTGIGDADLH